MKNKSLKWFTFRQNNSGGSFDRNENVSEHVCIQAPSASEANDIAENLGIYFNGVEDGMDCECCGDRWYPAWDRLDTADAPLIYGKPAVDRPQKDVRIHPYVKA